jgi:hypothetical protein
MKAYLTEENKTNENPINKSTSNNILDTSNIIKNENLSNCLTHANSSPEINNLKPELTINNEQPDINTEVLNRLVMIFNKYKTVFEPDDLADFQTILDTLKSNLSD